MYKVVEIEGRWQDICKYEARGVILYGWANQFLWGAFALKKIKPKKTNNLEVMNTNEYFE